MKSPANIRATLASLLVLSVTQLHADTIRFAPFYEVEMQDVIWAPRIEQLVAKTLPHAFRSTEEAKRSLQLCAEWLESGGKTPKPDPHRFRTSDLYKVLEGAALMLKKSPNPDVERLIDESVDLIARAQQPDGYLYVSHVTGAINEREMGLRPYSYLLHSHELYNVGHLYEAAVAYAQATGKIKLLDVAEKSARHVNRVIFEGGDTNYNNGHPIMQAPGHQEIEIGLLKLYGQTGEKLYLEMAKKFLDIRGVTFRPNQSGVSSPTYAQQHKPVAEQRKAVGHAVRATYQYAAMAEVDSLQDSRDFSAALDAIWHDIVDTKMHITGGLGAVHGIEGFGPAYELPNEEAYLETCAAVGNVFFNTRMFLKYQDAKFIDVAEIALLNNCLAGIGLDGASFFYPNPLEAHTGHAPRSAWFGTACCPSNLARLIPQVSGYQYATEPGRLYALLYASSTAKLRLDEASVQIRQETEYPYHGKIKFHVRPETPQQFTFLFRIPTWTGKQLLPGELYNFADDAPSWSLMINDEPIDVAVDKGFVAIERTWSPGDEVTLNLPMPVRVNQCLSKVAANRNRVAFSRGPLVLCGEQADNEGAVQRFIVNPNLALANVKVSTIGDSLLAGLPLVTIAGKELVSDGPPSPTTIRLVPYFAWSNRDRGSMITWFPTTPKLAQPDYGDPRNLKFAAATASHTFERDTVDAIRMRHTPSSSFDTTIRRWTGWPQVGDPQWIEIDLGGLTAIGSVGVYWYDDRGGVQVPASWSLQSHSGEQWADVEIYNTDTFSTLRDTYNTVHPANRLVADKLRIQMQPQHEKTSVGILSVDITKAAGNPQLGGGNENDDDGA